jgi:glycogen operon protein
MTKQPRSTRPSSGPAPPIRSAPPWDGEGVNFAIYSRHAEKVELCLFDEGGSAR